MNTETRALIKRSTRAGDLERRFKIEEMSSISTLEVAWEHKSLWSGDLVQRNIFCYRVAETNKLELLKWAREEKKCDWDEGTIIAAASEGNLEMVKYCVANECPIDEGVCACCREGHLECFKYLHEEAKAPWGSYTANLRGYQVAISTYSNILLSASTSIINSTHMRVSVWQSTATWTV